MFVEGSIPPRHRRHHGRPLADPAVPVPAKAVGGRDLRTVASCRPEVDCGFCCLAAGLGHHRRGVACDHRARPDGDRPATTNRHHQGRGPLGARLRRPRCGVRGGTVHLPAGVGGPGVRRRVHHRIQPERGQPVRVHDHHGPVLGACTGSGQGPLHRDRVVAGAPRRLHIRRCGGDRRGELGVLLARRFPDLHRDPAGAERIPTRSRTSTTTLRCGSCTGSCPSARTTTAGGSSPARASAACSPRW